MSLSDDPDEVMLITAKRRRLSEGTTSLARFIPAAPRLGKGQAMQRMDTRSADERRSTQPAKPQQRRWVLQDASGKALHIGTPEEGLAGTASRLPYFVLVREGDHYVAQHVSEWLTFRPEIRHATFTLDDAEKQMNNPRIAFAANMARLKKYADQEDEGRDLHLTEAQKADAEEAQNEADEATARPRAAPDDDQKGWSNKGNERPDGAQGVEGDAEKPEDWEHEEERADDDVDMGDDAGSDPGGASPPKQEPQKGRRTASPEASSGSDSEAEEDEDDDRAAVDLDALHGASQAKPSSRSRTPDARQSGAGKRKAPSASPQPAKAAKKAKTAAPAALPPLTAAEVVACLKRHGGLTSAELTERLQVKQRSEADKKAYAGLVKAVAKLEVVDGRKLVVLK